MGEGFSTLRNDATSTPTRENVVGDRSDAQSSPSSDEGRIYGNSSTHNKCLIINNAFKGQGDHERPGTDKDKEDLRKLFSYLGYEVIVEDELGGQEMIDCLKSFVRDPEQENASSTVVIVLSHGNNDGLEGVDNKIAPIETFLACLNGKNAPLLAGKPKLVFIQACRGGKEDRGCAIVASDHSPNNNTHELEMLIPTESDILVGYSTPPSYAALRHPNLGSWFMQELCEVFSKHARTEHVLDMLTSVNSRVAERTGRSQGTGQTIKQTPEVRYTLHKKFYFFSGALTTYNEQQFQDWCAKEQVNQNVVLKCNERMPDGKIISCLDGSVLVLHNGGVDYFIHCPYSTNLYLKARYRGSALRNVRYCELIPNTTIVAYCYDQWKVEFLNLCNPKVPIDPISYNPPVFLVKATANTILVLEVGGKLLVHRIGSGEGRHKNIQNFNTYQPFIKSGRLEFAVTTHGVLAYLERNGTMICVRNIKGLRNVSRQSDKVTLELFKNCQHIRLGQNGTVVAVTSEESNHLMLNDVKSKQKIFESKDDHGRIFCMHTSEDDRFILLVTKETMICKSLRRAENGGVPSLEDCGTLAWDGGYVACPQFRNINGIPYIQFRTTENILKLYKFDDADKSWNPVLLEKMTFPEWDSLGQSAGATRRIIYSKRSSLHYIAH